ncbi:MAG: hypothetical protein ACRD6B_09790, partial [Bryobacteraceae bacterium]
MEPAASVAPVDAIAHRVHVVRSERRIQRSKRRAYFSNRLLNGNAVTDGEVIAAPKWHNDLRLGRL